jgi:hypothetical protein
MNKKLNLLNILLSRLAGSIDLSFTKFSLKKKKSYVVGFNFFHNLKKNQFDVKTFIKFFSFFNPESNKNYVNLSKYFLLLEFFFKNFYLYLQTNKIFSKPLTLTFFEKFSKLGLKVDKTSFPDPYSLSNTFFFFLKSRVKHYENIRYLLYTSFSQQIKIIEDINVANTLFKFILRKGKKLTARGVFLRFLKKFKKKYALPALPIFVHALLFIEPKVWLKKKKIAGKLYEIPIFISPSRSK